VTKEPDARILVAEARLARQRELVAQLKAQGSDASAEKSVLSALRYSLRLLKLHQRQAQRGGRAFRGSATAHGLGRA